MQKVSGDQDVARLAAESIVDARRRIVRLQIGRCREFGQRVADTPERLGRLTSPELAAVPDESGTGAASRGLIGRTRGLGLAKRGQRPARIDLRTDRVGVVD